MGLYMQEKNLRKMDGTRLSDNEIQEDINDGLIFALQEDIKKLQQDKQSLKQQKESLEIDAICLKQKNFELESRINQLVDTYPSASILLGKTPKESTMFTDRLKKRLFEREKK